MDAREGGVRMSTAGFIRSVITVGVGLVLAMVVWRGAETTITQMVSADWPRADGYVRNSRVVASEANPFIDDLQLDYTYQVGTDWMVCDRLTFFGRGLSLILRVGSADEMSEMYPQGAPIQVAYDPGNPERAVLSPGVSSAEFGGAALLILGVGGIAMGMLIHGTTGMLRQLEARREAQTGSGVITQGAGRAVRARAA